MSLSTLMQISALLSTVFDDVVRVSYATHVMLVFPMSSLPLGSTWMDRSSPTARHISRDNKGFAIVIISVLTAIYLAVIVVPSIWDAFL
jgi:solute carrier family 38 (sodium-coupled neutral amino acid transporter), member 2